MTTTEWIQLFTSVFGSLAGALAGASAANRFAKSLARNDRLILEIRNTNAAIALAYIVTHTMVGLKRNFFKPAIDKYRTDSEKYHTGSSIQKEQLEMNLGIISMPALPLSTLQDVLFDKLTVVGPCLNAAVTVFDRAEDLRRLIARHDTLVEAAQLRLEKAATDPKLFTDEQARYFGEQMTGGGRDTRFRDILFEIGQSFDSIIVFSEKLCVELNKNGLKQVDSLRKQKYRGELPEVQTFDFSQAAKDGLMPNPSNFSKWMDVIDNTRALAIKS